MTCRGLWAALVMVASVFLVAPVFAGDDDAFQAQARAAFAQVIKEYKIPGLVVGLTRNGQHSFYATGLASRADKRPVSAETLFELGSISKIFNVTLAALAEQRGLLSLDDKAARFLCADACSIGNDMTLMDLATHYSGGLPLQVPETASARYAQLLQHQHRPAGAYHGWGDGHELCTGDTDCAAP